MPVEKGSGTLLVTGVMEEEELGHSGRTVRRRSQARSSVDNCLTVLKSVWGLGLRDYDIHINFPGGVPVDGPSAGVGMLTAVASAISQKAVANTVAMTGEVTIHGSVRAVGGIVSKIRAAREAGVKRVLLPKENWQDVFREMDGLEITAVETIEEVLQAALLEQGEYTSYPSSARGQAGLLGAAAKITPGAIP